MSFAQSEGALNYCITRVRVGKPERSSMEALIFLETLPKPFALLMNVTISVISFCSCSFSSSSKLLIYVVLVLGLGPSCLLV